MPSARAPREGMGVDEGCLMLRPLERVRIKQQIVALRAICAFRGIVSTDFTAS
jgi:hypothetical protein